MASDKELSRQYRVAQQRLSMHAQLRDRFSRYAFLLDMALLACSVIFCATTFVPDSSFERLGFRSGMMPLVLGCASTGAFFFSLIAMMVDWKGQSAQHRDAVLKLDRLISEYRRCRLDDEKWPDERRMDLARAYSDTNENIVEIPASLFNSLKADYHANVALSKLISKHPGCPIWVLSAVLFFSAVWGVLRTKMQKGALNDSADPAID